ncbi:hypothetical protein AB0H83_31610 [Dactylosporangium sp. NPDC050688]|uniref:hypothetical protein n=1 Tax=Dactylosporangium sp. NPDC050688 TaxID=3157217 RepID=UPI0033FEB7A8
MAGLSIVVCLPPVAAADLTGAIGAAMAPFEAMCGYAAERDQWESWSIATVGGFRLRPGAAEDPRIVQPRPDGTCAGGPRGLLDLTGPSDAAQVAAGQLWDLFHEVRADLPPALPLEHLAALPEYQVPYVPVEPDGAGGYRLVPDPGREGARRRYRDQPLIRRLEAAPCYEAGVVHRLPEMLHWFTLSREQYVSARAEEVQRNAELLTVDGWWIERGYPPVHGACDSLATCPHREGRTEPWTWVEIAAHLEGLEGDVILVQLRCHV